MNQQFFLEIALSIVCLPVFSCQQQSTTPQPSLTFQSADNPSSSAVVAQNNTDSDARLTTKGYGESQPIADNQTPDGGDNPEGRAKNRRVEVIISK